MQYCILWGVWWRNETGWVFRGDAKLAHSAVWLGCVCGRTGLLFCGDAELAHSAIWLGVVVEGRDFCFEETPNWRIARFGWGWLWKDGTFVLGGRGIGA